MQGPFVPGTVGALETFWAWYERIAPAASGVPSWCPAVTWDIETERLDPASPTLCISWTDPSTGELCGHSGNMLTATGFLDLLVPGQLLCAHHMKYEAQSLIARGIDPRQYVWWDTMLAEWVLVANNPRGLGLNLDETSQRYGGTPKDPYVDEMIKAGRVMEIELGLLRDRNTKDVSDTAMVMSKQLARMTDAQVRLTIIRCMQALELAHIEGVPSKGIGGMRLDPVRVKSECDRNAAEIAEHEAALQDITRGANTRSVNEMAPVLYGLWPGDVPEAERVGVESLGFKEPAGTRTAASKPRKPLPPYKKTGLPRPVKPVAWPDGKPSIAKETMELLAKRARTPRQKLWAQHYLALNEAYSERDKNLMFFRGVLETAGGVCFAELMQGIVATHRLSCRSKLRVTVEGKEYGCQLQNVPRHLKGCFIAKREGWLAASVDQSQAEFRGAVWLGDDAQGRKDIDNPRFDAHIQTLTIMLHGPDNFQANYDALFDLYKAGDKKVKWQRADNKLCKSHTFKPLFGGKSGTDQERAYYEWFGKRYSGVTAAQEEWRKGVEGTGQYISPTGMVFHWDRKWETGNWGRLRMVNANTGNSLYTVISNTPIQYFATGELAMVSTLCLLYEARLRHLRYECVMLTHDDTSGECHPDDIPAWRMACADSYGPMTWKFLFDVYGINYDVELAAESKAGVRFGEGATQEHTYISPIPSLTEDEQYTMKVSAKGNGPSRAPDIKEGTHIAIVNALVDLGVQPGTDKYPAQKRKVYVGFEFPKCIIDFPARDDKPSSKSPAREGRFMALTMNEKASFRKMIASLRGKPFASDREAENFDLQTILGMPCMISVSHKVVGDKTYCNLGDPVPLIEGMTLTDTLAKPALFYDTDAHDSASYDALPDWMKKIVDARIISKGGASNAPAPITGGLPELGQE